MTGPGSSSTSSLTSHTLTHGTIMMGSFPAQQKATDERLALLKSTEPESRHTFAEPSKSLQRGSYEVTKDTLDHFAGLVSDDQQRRLRDSLKKRKSALNHGLDRPEVLKIRKLYLDGFDSDQVWQQ